MSISRHNERAYYISEFLAGLIFHMPVWVAYELQYITLAQLALVEAILQGTQLLMEMPTGAAADLWGKRVSIGIGRIFLVIGITLYAFAQDFAAFAIVAVIMGIGDSFISGAKEALIYDSLKQDNEEKRYAKINAKAGVLFQTSFAFAILSGGLLSMWGYKAAIFASLLAYIALVFQTFLFKEPRIDTQKFTLPLYIHQLRTGFRELFKNPYIKNISLFYIGVGGITWAGIMVFNTSLLTTIGFTTVEIGVVMASVRLFNSFVLFKAVHIDNFITKKRVYLFFPILMIISYLPGVLLTKHLAIFAVAGATIASTARWAILGQYVNEQYDSRYRATALSTLSMCIALAVVGLTILSTYIMNYGGVKAMYTLLGLISLIVLLPLGLRIQRRYHAFT